MFNQVQMVNQLSVKNREFVNFTIENGNYKLSSNPETLRSHQYPLSSNVKIPSSPSQMVMPKSPTLPNKRSGNAGKRPFNKPEKQSLRKLIPKPTITKQSQRTRTYDHISKTTRLSSIAETKSKSVLSRNKKKISACSITKTDSQLDAIAELVFNSSQQKRQEEAQQLYQQHRHVPPQPCDFTQLILTENELQCLQREQNNQQMILSNDYLLPSNIPTDEFDPMSSPHYLPSDATTHQLSNSLPDNAFINYPCNQFLDDPLSLHPSTQLPQPHFQHTASDSYLHAGVDHFGPHFVSNEPLNHMNIADH